MHPLNPLTEHEITAAASAAKAYGNAPHPLRFNCVSLQVRAALRATCRAFRLIAETAAESD